MLRRTMLFVSNLFGREGAKRSQLLFVFLGGWGGGVAYMYIYIYIYIYICVCTIHISVFAGPCG